MGMPRIEWADGELDLAEDCGELDATATFSGDQVLYYRQSEEAKRCR